MGSDPALETPCGRGHDDYGMTTRIDDNAVTIDHGLESRHRALWALGDYATVATEVVAPLGPVLVQASGVGAGDRVLDIAAGSGNVAIPPRSSARM